MLTYHQSPPIRYLWEDDETFVTKIFNNREQILWYNWYIFLIFEHHYEEVIHSRWIFILPRVFFLEHLSEWWVHLPQCSQGWRSKHWSFTWSTRSQCWHLTIYVCCATGACEDGSSWRNPTLQNWMSLEYSGIWKYHPFYIWDQFYSCCSQLLPKVSQRYWEVHVENLHLLANILLKWLHYFNQSSIVDGSQAQTWICPEQEPVHNYNSSIVAHLALAVPQAPKTPSCPKYFVNRFVC